jgi:hypothetical protein
MTIQKRTSTFTWKAFLPLAIIAFVLLGLLVQNIRQDRALKRFQALDAAMVHTVNIYPSIATPVGSPVVFHPPHALIDEFIRSLSDLQPYAPNHDTVSSHEKSWFMEFVTQDGVIQLKCYIPYGRGGIVVGELGEWSTGAQWRHALFQSQALYVWYRLHHEEWLNIPEAAS